MQLETLIKKKKVERLTNLIDVAYTIGNFDQKLPTVIFLTFVHLCKYEKKIHHFIEKPHGESMEKELFLSLINWKHCEVMTWRKPRRPGAVRSPLLLCGVGRHC